MHFDGENRPVWILRPIQVGENDAHQRWLEHFQMIDNRPTAEELEKLELPWRWRSFSVSCHWHEKHREHIFDLLHSWSAIGVATDWFFKVKGLVMSNVSIRMVRLINLEFAYALSRNIVSTWMLTSFLSRFQINEYIYAVEGVNVLRRSGKEVERLLSMFDKCTIYTVYNYEEFPPLGTPPNELNIHRHYSSKQLLNPSSSSSNDYNNNSTDDLLTTTNTPNDSLNSIPLRSSPSVTSPLSSQQQQQHQTASPSSSIDGTSSCSVSPKHSLTNSTATSTTTKSRTLTKPFSFFKLNSRSRSNLTSSNTLK